MKCISRIDTYWKTNFILQQKANIYNKLFCELISCVLFVASCCNASKADLHFIVNILRSRKNFNIIQIGVFSYWVRIFYNRFHFGTVVRIVNDCKFLVFVTVTVYFTRFGVIALFWFNIIATIFPFWIWKELGKTYLEQNNYKC